MSVDLLGTDEFIDGGNESHINNSFDGGGSIAFWFKWDDSGATDTIVSKDTAGTNGWLIQLITTDNHVRFYVNNATTDGIWDTPDAGISTATWYHFAITYDDDSPGTTPVMYLDGVAVTVTETQGGVGLFQTDSSSTLFVGKNQAADEFFNGKIEDFRIWKERVLTAEDVAALAAGYRGIIGRTRNVAESLWWSCDDFEGLANPEGSTLTAGTHYLHDKSINDQRGNPTGDPVALAFDGPLMFAWAPQALYTAVTPGTEATGFLDVSISAEMYLDVALVNTDDPIGRV